MASEKGTVYIKAEQCTEVSLREVTLGDIISVECTSPHITAKLKTLKVFSFWGNSESKRVFSVLKIIEWIHKEYPNVVVQNLGVSDLIVIYRPEKKENKLWQYMKIAFVCIVSFVGSAFAIMTFNNDSGTSQLFEQIYELFTGKTYPGFSILELMYSVGLSLGILVFFNHFGKRKFSEDPTPIEVEMRLYESDIEATLISDGSRRGKELDVD